MPMGPCQALQKSSAPEEGTEPPWLGTGAQTPPHPPTARGFAASVGPVGKMFSLPAFAFLRGRRGSLLGEGELRLCPWAEISVSAQLQGVQTLLGSWMLLLWV